MYTVKCIYHARTKLHILLHRWYYVMTVWLHALIHGRQRWTELWQHMPHLYRMHLCSKNVKAATEMPAKTTTSQQLLTTTTSTMTLTSKNKEGTINNRNRSSKACINIQKLTIFQHSKLQSEHHNNRDITMNNTFHNDLWKCLSICFTSSLYLLWRLSHKRNCHSPFVARNDLSRFNTINAVIMFKLPHCFSGLPLFLVPDKCPLNYMVSHNYWDPQFITVQLLKWVAEWKHIKLCRNMGTCLVSAIWHCWLGVRKSIQPAKTEWWGIGVVICLKWCADCLHIVRLMPLPSQNLTIISVIWLI